MVTKKGQLVIALAALEYVIAMTESTSPRFAILNDIWIKLHGLRATERD